jgi:hypothetical protein
MKTTRERFFSKVKINDVTGCHEWTGAKFRDGYGQFRVGNGTLKMISAHRWICEPIPEGMLVLHKCDNRSCVNRDHLFFGSHKENMTDMVAKNRQAKGARCAKTKLTEDQVKEIRKDTRRQRDIADAYGVGKSLISYIKRKEIWTHVD